MVALRPAPFFLPNHILFLSTEYILNFLVTTNFFSRIFFVLSFFFLKILGAPGGGGEVFFLNSPHDIIRNISTSIHLWNRENHHREYFFLGRGFYHVRPQENRTIHHAVAISGDVFFGVIWYTFFQQH